MATPRGLEDLAAGGLPGAELSAAGANDLVLAVRARTTTPLSRPRWTAGWRGRVRRARADARPGGPQQAADAASPRRVAPRPERQRRRSCRCPGEYAALEAHHALTAGLHVLLFSDDVPVEEEIELKERAAAARAAGDGPGRRHGRAGRHRAGLRQRARAPRARRCAAVGVVAAAGTGAQEVSALLDRWGVRRLAGDRRRRPRPVRARSAGGWRGSPCGRSTTIRGPTWCCWSPSRRTPPSAEAVLAECRRRRPSRSSSGSSSVAAAARGRASAVRTLEEGARAAARARRAPSPARLDRSARSGSPRRPPGWRPAGATCAVCSPGGRSATRRS